MIVPWEQPKFHTIKFLDNYSWVMGYSETRGIIVIGEEGALYPNLVESEIEAILSHETIHGVLYKLEGSDTCGAYDNLGEVGGHTPYSFPIAVGDKGRG